MTERAALRPRARTRIRTRDDYAHAWACFNGFKLSRHWHQPEDDLGQRREPGGLAVLAGLVAASGALGRAFVAASGAGRDEVPVPGDLGGQAGGELVKEARGKSIRSR